MRGLTPGHRDCTTPLEGGGRGRQEEATMSELGPQSSLENHNTQKTHKTRIAVTPMGPVSRSSVGLDPCQCLRK